MSDDVCHKCGCRAQDADECGDHRGHYCYRCKSKLREQPSDTEEPGMSEGRCGTCRWWEHLWDNYGDCALISKDREGPQSPEASCDSFLTRGDFGCVLWEPSSMGSEYVTDQGTFRVKAFAGSVIHET